MPPRGGVAEAHPIAAGEVQAVLPRLAGDQEVDHPLAPLYEGVGQELAVATVRVRFGTGDGRAAPDGPLEEGLGARAKASLRMGSA